MSKAVQVPDGWKPAKIKDAAQVNPRSNSVDDDSLVTFLPMTAVSESGLIQGAEIRKVIDVKKGFTSFETGDVLVAKITPCFENYKGCLCTDLKNDRGYGSTEFHVLRPNKNITGEYLHTITRTHHFRGTGELNMTGTAGQKRVPTIFLRNYDFPLPPLPEQKAIAALLSTWDEAIEKTERLIQAKEKTFKQLLNDLIHQGRSNHTWKGYNLSDLCSPVSRKNSENNTNVLTSSAQNGLVSQLEYYNKSVSAENVTGYYLLKKGEFAYNRSSAKGYPYGATKRLDRYEKGVLSTLYLCFALKPNAPCESDFLLHLFESGAANRELRAVCQEGARSHGLLNITKSDFFGIKIFLPTQEQQKKIQSALNTAQYEIDLLKQLADKYKTQKRGLMQKMLTGEWRVKPEIVNQYMEA